MTSMGGYGILSCDGVGNSPQGLNNEANARLIAAAPELLDFVIEYLDAWNSGMAGDSHLRRMAEALIQKATGASHVSQQ